MCGCRGRALHRASGYAATDGSDFRPAGGARPLATQASYDYDVYGRLMGGRFERVSDLGYTGKKVDPVTGWYNSGYRDYSPMTMRFTTTDPIRSGSNWYAYVNGDPVNYVDPWGLEASDNATLGQWGGGSMEAQTALPPAPAAETPAERLLQTNQSIAVQNSGQNAMAARGCFFLSDLGTVQTLTGHTFTAEEILDIVSTTQTNGTLNANMSVVPGRAADVATAALAAAGRSDLVARETRGTPADPADASLVGGVLANGGPHWREGNEEGNVVWDPYPGLDFQAGRSEASHVYLRFGRATPLRGLR